MLTWIIPADAQYEASRTRWNKLGTALNISEMIGSPHIQRVVALPDGRAVIGIPISGSAWKVHVVDKTGKSSQEPQETLNIRRMFTTEQYLYVIQETPFQTNFISRSSLDEVANFQNYTLGKQFGSLIDGCYFSENQILISGYTKDYSYEQFVLFNTGTNSFKLVRNLVNENGLVTCNWRNRCILIEPEEHQKDNPKVKIIHLDKETWKNQTVNLHLKDQRRMFIYTPGSIEITDYGSLLFVDSENFRVTEYTSTGEFLRHWITEKDCHGKPFWVSYNHPYLWVIYSYATEKYRMELIRYSFDKDGNPQAT